MSTNFANRAVAYAGIATPTLTLATDSGSSSSSTDGITNKKTVNVDGLVAGASWQYSQDGGSTWKTGSGSSFELNADKTRKLTLADVTASSVTAKLGGGWVESRNAATLTDFRVVGATKTAWMIVEDGGYTKGVKLEFSSDASGLLQVKAVDAAYAWGSHIRDWTSTLLTTTGLSDSDSVAGYGILSLKIGAVAVADSGYLSGYRNYRVDGLTEAAEGATYTYAVRQTDAASNVATSAFKTYTLDTRIATPTLSLATDTGSSSTDGITNKFTSVNVGGLEAGASWQYSMDGGRVWTTGSGSSFELSSEPRKLKLADVTVDSLQARLGGGWIFTREPATVADFRTFGAVKKAWMLVEDGGDTKGVKLEFAEDASGQLQVRTIDAAYAQGSRVHDWAYAPKRHVDLGESDLGNGYGIWSLKIGASGVAGGGYLSVEKYQNFESEFKLTDGFNCLVRQTDAAGNTATSAAVKYLVDTTVASPTLKLARDSGSSSTDGITNGKTVNVEGLESGASWQYSLDGGGTWKTGERNYFDFPADTSATGKVYAKDAVQVRQTDAAGNTSAAGKNSAAWTFDTRAATPTISLATDSGSSGTDGITKVKTVKVGGLESGANSQYQVDGGGWKTLGNMSLSDLKPEDIKGVIDGSVWLGPQAATPTDFRIIGSTKIVWMLIAEQGFLKGVRLEFSDDASGKLQVRATEAADALGTDFNRWTELDKYNKKVVFADYDYGYGIKSVEVGAAKVTGSGFLRADSNTTVDALNLVLTEGTHNYAVRQTDAAGNTTTSATVSYTLDTVAPAQVSLSAQNIRRTQAVHFGETLNPYVDVDGLVPGGGWEYSVDAGGTWQKGSGKTFDLPRKNLITNGDFNDAYNSFTTNYAKGVMRPGGIVNTTAFNDKGDVWTGQGADRGNFLYVDGAALGGFWHQRVYMEKGAMYEFSFYRRATADCRVYGTPTVEMTVNWAGTGAGDWREIVPSQKDTFSTTGWARVTRVFRAETSGESTLALQDANGSGDANDFGIDSISLVKYEMAAGQARVRHTDVAGNQTTTLAAAITPIALDLDASGAIETLGLSGSSGTFDLKNDGQAVHSAWIGKGDAWLAVDENGNGQIDNRDELLGGEGARDAFIKLAGHDGNGDGVVDAADAGFDRLRIWRDANGDHQSQPDELLGLLAAGVKSLTVQADTRNWWVDAQGVTHGDTATATLANGREVALTDLWLPVAVSGHGLPHAQVQPATWAVLA